MKHCTGCLYKCEGSLVENEVYGNIKVALVGNQNSGKTTLFNLLTGMNQKVGNWPGVTIERKEGIIKGTNIKLVDLPGIYALSSYSSEEKIASKYIFEEKPDIIINILDATCLERSLYLTTQILETGIDVIIALNMIDLLEKKGISIDIESLEKELGVNVCKISALRQEGIENLIQTVKKIATVRKNKNNSALLDLKKKEMLEEQDEEKEEEIATQRYEYVSYIKEKCMYKKKKWIKPTDLLDKIFLNKFLAIPIFIIIMFGIYFLSVGVIGTYVSDIVDNFLELVTNFIEQILYKISVAEWLQSLIIDGILSGVGSVLNFIPQLIILFFLISILESSGYMSRIAFLLDKIFRKIGLSGKALIPFILGSGCSVPAIMSTRIIENESERKKTSILVPFVPCSAKLLIIAFFSNYFFKEYAGAISASIYFLSVIIIIINAKLMQKYIKEEDNLTFIYELPEYKIPDFKYVLKDVWTKTWSFIKRAGTTILLASVAVWFLLSFSCNLQYGVSIENSILAIIGKKISWIFYPILGINSWEATVSCLQGLIAKEQVVSSMTIISELSNKSILNSFTISSAYAYVIFNLFSAPCIATITTMKKELSSLGKLFFVVFYQTGLAWVLAFIVKCIIEGII